MEHYQELFQPPRDGRGSESEAHRMARHSLVPPLVRALERLDLEPRATHDFRHLVRFQEKRRGRMHLFQISDPRYQPAMTASDSFALFLYRAGGPVGCAALRLKWIETTLEEELTLLRLYYDDVAAMARPAERCLVSAPTARLIASCAVAVSTSLCLDRDQADGTAIRPLMRLLHLWAVVHWRWTWLVGFAGRAVARAYGHGIHGFAGAELGVWRTRPTDRPSAGAELPLHEFLLLTASRRHAVETFLRPELADLSRPLVRPMVQRVDAAA